MSEKIRAIKECMRPIISERHDFSATLFKDKECKEPLFHVAAKGDFKIDIFKVISWFLVMLLTFSAFSVSLQSRKHRKKKMKKLKAELKAARRQNK